MSRFLISSRQETEIKPELNLSLYIGRAEFWSKDVSNHDSFENEIFDICKIDIKICNSYRVYEILGGDKILCMDLGLNIIDEPVPGSGTGNNDDDDDEDRPDDEL